jgi:hypothetical protein
VGCVDLVEDGVKYRKFHMKLLARLSLISIFFLPPNAGWAGTPQESAAIEQPPAKTTEPWEITVGGPGWLAGVSDTTGFHGINSNVNVGIGEILKHINVVYSFSGEVRKGRFGVFGDLLYLNGQAGTGEGSGLVSKVDLGLQQFLGEFFTSYRVIEGPHGWLDLLAGFRYTYLGQQVDLQANNFAINTASAQLVNQFAAQISTSASGLRNLVQQDIVDKLNSLNGNRPTLPVAPIAGTGPGKIRDAVQQLIQGREGELVAAIRADATARVNQLKAQLKQIQARGLYGEGLRALHLNRISSPNSIYDTV